MFLLNQNAVSDVATFDGFTFHYVSIKSAEVCPSEVYTANLHSTMFLLNPKKLLGVYHYANGFTFHYVSIKSTTSVIMGGLTLTFTFHYVSIKSMLSGKGMSAEQNLHSTMFLLNR